MKQEPPLELCNRIFGGFLLAVPVTLGPVKKGWQVTTFFFLSGLFEVRIKIGMTVILM